MRKSKRTQAQERAAADRDYLEQVRGDAADAGPSGVQPVPPVDHGVQTESMPHVPTAAPSPLLGVSPILGETVHPSAPPVGSFTTPPVGPPAPAYASQAFTPSPEGPTGSSPAAGWPAASGAQAAAGAPVPSGTAHGPGPGPLYRAGSGQRTSVIEQDPIDLRKANVATLPPLPPYAQLPITNSGLDLPLLLGPAGVAPGGDLVTCPECGEMATVYAARRNSEDFCRNCDFPLFWARSTVILPSGEETGASLRRLPGTVGRAATAALLCPHCGEPNSPIAQNCVRCLLSLHPVEVVAAPVYVPPPEPELMPVPIGRYFPLWWILLVSGSVLAIALIAVWIAVN